VGVKSPFFGELISLATKEMVEHLPCGPARREAYASMDWVDRYMMDIDTLYGTSLVIIDTVLHSIAHTAHWTVQGNTRVCHSTRDYTLAHGVAQQRFREFPSGRPPDKVIEYIIGLRLPRISEWMVEPQRTVYPSMTNFHLRNHRAWVKEQGTHSFVLGSRALSFGELIRRSMFSYKGDG
jgi:hypothetical protein